MFLLASAVDPDQDLMLVRGKNNVVDLGCGSNKYNRKGEKKLVVLAFF
jgi:hypothetical protein